MFNPMQLRIFRICVFSLLLTVSIALPAFAQSGPTGSLGGVVTDNSGAAVAGAKVNVSSSDTGLTRNTTADAEGRWQIAVLPTGNYKITVEAQGFKKAVAQAAVEAAVPRLLDLKLEVGEVTVEVQITDTAPLVTPNTSTTFRQLTGAELVQVPTSTRSFTHLLTAEAGVSSDLSPVLTNGTGNISPSVNGTRTTSTSLTFNGVDATNLTTNEGSMSDNISPAPETLAEVKLQTSLYDASTGRSGGGNFQLITKGGTNKFSGSAYYYGQHERLNANDYFFNRDAIDKPEARRNEGGFTIGGPVVKDKVHFFAGYQITRARTAFVPTASSQVVLPEALRLISGNRTAANIVSAFRSLNPSFALTEAQISPTILNLLNLKNPVTGDFFIPAPKAIGAGGERVGTDTTVAPHTGGNPLIRQRNVEPAEFEQDQFTLRMDDQLTGNNRLSGTFFFANFPGTDPFPDPSSLASPVVLRRNDRNRTVAISDIHTFGSALINEARFGYFHLNNTRSLTDPFIAITNDSVGIPNPANFYDKTAATTRLGHYVFRNNLSNLSFGGPNDSFNRRKQQTFSFADTMTWIKNNHNFRFGGEFKRHQYDSNLPEEQATEFEKWENFTQFLTGLATEADTQFGITDKSFRMRDLSFFFTDDWKLGKRTTLNVGVRWDWFGWPEEKDGRIGNVDFSKINDTLNPSNAFIVPKNVQTTGFAAIDQTIAVTAKANNNHTLKGQDLNNFQPRFGFAFSPFDNNRLVVRGGYGIFFDRPSASFINTVFSNYPFLREVEVTAPSRGVPITTAYSQQDPTLPFNRYLPNRIVWQSGGTFVIRDGTPVTRQANGTSNPVDLATGQPTLGNIAETFEFRAVDTGLRTPYIQQWNLGIQFEIAKDMLFEARYIGTKGTKLLQGVAFNQGYDLNSSNAPDAVFKRFNDAYARAYSYTQANNPGQLATLFPNGALRTASTERERGRGIAFGFPNSTLGGAIDYNLSNAAGAVIGFEARTPILGFNVPEALVLSSSANSIYNALQLGLTKRFSKGLQYNLAYTWSKSLDNNSSDPGSTAGGGKPDVPNTGFVVQGDQRNLANNRGVSDFDRTNRFSASFVYELPFAGSRFVKGWQVSGFAQMQTGTPFSIFAAEPEVGTAAQYTGVLRGSGGLYRSGFGRPSLCGTLDQLRTQGSDKTQSYFNASVLCSPLTTAGGYPNNQGFGNLGRNVLRAPYQKRFDLGFSKDTRITETVGFEFRWDIFNIFNNANFAAPANDLQDATDFGKITNTIGGPRVMQFGFKLKF